MLHNLNSQQILFAVILIGALLLFITEWIRSDIVAVLIVVSLYVTRVLNPGEALSGFSSEPAIVVAGIFVFRLLLFRNYLLEILSPLFLSLLISILRRLY